MQRGSYDVGSIAALLRQTEVNLSALSRPEPAPAPLIRIAPEAAAYPAAVTEPPTFAATSSVNRGSATGVEVEAQLLHLRGCMETLERRLEEELRAVIGVCEKRLQAKEQQLHGVADSVRANADGVAESLSRRIDARLRDLERKSDDRGGRAVEEVWENVRRLQADTKQLEGRLQRVAHAEDFTERITEATRTLQQQLDERLVGHERRAADYRAQMETNVEAWRESMGQRCHALESRIWESHADRGDLSEVVLKKLPDMAPLRELKEEARANAYASEVLQRRLTSCEGKMAKMQALEAKVEFVESQTAQQIEEQAQLTRGVSDATQRLSQKIVGAESTCQRV